MCVRVCEWGAGQGAGRNAANSPSLAERTSISIVRLLLSDRKSVV